MPPRRPHKARPASGVYRGGLEDAVAAQLRTLGVPVLYECVRIPFIQPETKRRYTPDFVLPNGIIVETKGHFETADRQKHKMVKASHPDLDIRFVFSDSRTRISKQSQTTYAMWCESYGFKYADKMIPLSWIHEPVNEKSLAIIRQLMEEQQR